MSDTDEFNEKSKSQLLKIVTTKVRTTMIGALDAFESNILDSDFYDSLDEVSQIELKELYSNFRLCVLSLGNDSIRAIENELKQYEVKWNRYRMNFKMKKREQ